MTDSSSETTEVMPTAEPVVGPPQVPADAPAPEYVTPVHKPVSGTSKVVIAVAAVVLGFVVLGGTFASGVMVGSHVGGGRGGGVAQQRGQFGAQGQGTNGGGFEGQRGGRHGGGGRGGFGGRGGQMSPQGQTAPQGQVAPQTQTAPGGSNAQPQ
jgi:hypothetical protein